MSLEICLKFCDLSQPTAKDDGTAIFEMNTETAWEPCRKLFQLMSKKFDVEIYYLAEELGLEVLETNDIDSVYFTEKYVMEVDQCGIDNYDSFEGMAAEIGRLVGKTPSSFNEADELVSSSTDFDINIYEIQRILLQD